MLLIQAPKGSSEPGQAYKMRIFVKIVNGLKFILRIIWWTLMVYLSGHLDTWISDTSDPTDLNTTNNYLFCTFQSLGSWLIGSRVQKYKNISDKNPKPAVTSSTLKQLVWMAALISYSMAWSAGSPKFICLGISFSHHLDQRISDPFFQTNSL